MTVGYSGSPQAKKLGIKPGVRLALHRTPAGWRFDADPTDATLVTDDGPADVLIAFVTSADDVLTDIDSLRERVFPAGALWIAWPRKAAGHVSDVTENLIRDTALERGLVDVKVAALSEDWSALKLVWRIENRTRQ
ncbi:DUF3052 domain-containing protein [Plantibacter sp. Mn2098]|uniref:DUF3052 domain-containing protein n=1 Tax=Plantibacter sp. Mn2098 TaxID=3395266 RepID=UPI003BEABE1F